jgi:hypothetical protein
LLGATANLLKSFEDNPSRRLANLSAGGLLGIGVAAVLGLDGFAAAGGITGLAGWRALAAAMTGPIMGLGSNPTHAIIKTLQASKDRSAQAQPST